MRGAVGAGTVTVRGWKKRAGSAADANPIQASGRHRYGKSRLYSAPKRKLKPAE